MNNPPWRTGRHRLANGMRRSADQMLGRKQLRRRDQLVIARRQQVNRGPHLRQDRSVCPRRRIDRPRSRFACTASRSPRDNRFRADRRSTRTNPGRSLRAAAKAGEPIGFARLQHLMNIVGVERFRSPELLHLVAEHAAVAQLHQFMKQRQRAGVGERGQRRIARRRYRSARRPAPACAPWRENARHRAATASRPDKARPDRRCRRAWSTSTLRSAR